MRFNTGFFDSLFGEKVTLEIPGDDGRIIKRTVTKKWLEQMQRQGKMSPVSQPVVRAHVLSPSGYSVQNWVIGDDIPADTCERFRDSITGDIYVMSFFEAGTERTQVITKPLWEEARKMLDAV